MVKGLSLYLSLLFLSLTNERKKKSTVISRTAYAGVDLCHAENVR
jgi:hypothetical protein